MTAAMWILGLLALAAGGVARYLWRDVRRGRVNDAQFAVFVLCSYMTKFFLVVLVVLAFLALIRS